ncbi:MAG: zinc ribbon domain-containing protein [Acidobacteriia bacterium]|nr:zinc ribbon domain-containing protein [Terriglobia bacterium]MYG04677.1 zinc ribbon domain-containing protein [Terriglobia bacterium]MYK10652.1 zinc ribbon domain-containing protein [Terriglobia bacterium]
MPIYEYQCGDCDSRFEALVMGSAPEPDSCECGSNSIERVYSTFSASSGNSPAEACPTPAEQRCGGPSCMDGMCGMH